MKLDIKGIEPFLLLDNNLNNNLPLDYVFFGCGLFPTVNVKINPHNYRFIYRIRDTINIYNSLQDIFYIFYIFYILYFFL